MEPHPTLLRQQSFVQCSCPGPGKSWIVLESKSQIFRDLESPGIRPWSWKILVSYMESPGKQTALGRNADVFQREAF